MRFLNVIFNCRIYLNVSLSIVSVYFVMIPVYRLDRTLRSGPGLYQKTDGKIVCQPILFRVISLFAEQNDLQYAVPGGLIGVLTCYYGDVII